MTVGVGGYRGAPSRMAWSSAVSAAVNRRQGRDPAGRRARVGCLPIRGLCVRSANASQSLASPSAQGGRCSRVQNVCALSERQTAELGSSAGRRNYGISQSVRAWPLTWRQAWRPARPKDDVVVCDARNAALKSMGEENNAYCDAFLRFRQRHPESHSIP
jgi:hypothetical protein